MRYLIPYPSQNKDNVVGVGSGWNINVQLNSCSLTIIDSAQRDISYGPLFGDSGTYYAEHPGTLLVRGYKIKPDCLLGLLCRETFECTGANSNEYCTERAYSLI